MSAVAVIDFGKTNVKVALVDTGAGREVGVRTLPNTVRPGPPYPHYDTAAHWEFVLGALRELGSERRIDAISITTHGATVALVDADGALALPILDYEHDGPDTLAAEYDAIRPPFEESGTPRLACGLNVGAQLFWQFATFPEAARRVTHVLTYPQYWAFRLSGVHATEVTSVACHTDLWSPVAGNLSSLVERQRWTDLFPPLRPATDTLGPIRPEVAEATGLDPATPVLCGIHDSNASLYPHLLARQGAFAVVSTGTWVVCMAVGGAEVTLDPARDTLVNVNARGEPVPSAKFMGGREYEIVRAGEDATPTDADRRAVLERGVMLLPAVEPATGPFPGRKSTWTAEPATSRERMLALSWHLAMMTDTCLSMIGAEGPVVVEGPFARNRDYLEMLAAATGRAVEPAAGNLTGTSIGAALLAGGAAPPIPPAAAPAPPNQALIDYATTWRHAVTR